MAPRTRSQRWNSVRNAITLLLLGLIGIQFSEVTGIAHLPVALPAAIHVILLLVGWICLGLGLMLVVVLFVAVRE